MKAGCAVPSTPLGLSGLGVPDISARVGKPSVAGKVTGTWTMVAWTGDHCSVDPEIVRGIFFINRKLTTGREPYIADVYKTVLGALGVKAPYEVDGVGVELR